MIDVNWDIAADGTAVRLVTCEDAVYWAKDGYIWHNSGAYWVKSDPDFIFQTLATRTTQTKTVADSSQSSCSEGEKWTHIDAFGDPCRILIEEKDNLGYVVILRQSGHYATPAASSLKPIKPTIDESQAWVKMQSLIPKHGVTAAYQMTIQQYEII